MANSNFKVKTGVEVPNIDAVFTSDQSAPSVRPSLNLNFAKTKTLDPRITFTRASTATYYDGETTVVGDQNLLANSTTLSDSGYWFNGNLVITAGQTAPDGTTTAVKIAASAVSNQHYLNTIAANIRANTGNIISFYAKAGERTIIQCNPNDSGRSASFNLSTGVVASQTGVTASMVSIGSGWYRCVMIHNTGLFDGVYFWPDNSTGIYTGDGTSGLYVCWPQLENHTAATGYFPTTTAPISQYIPKLQTAAANVARFDHEPTTGESKGLLVESSRTNLLLYSGTLSNGVWGLSIGGTGTASVIHNHTIAPDGTLSASRVTMTVPDASASGNYAGYVQNTTVTSGVVYAGSIFIKAATAADVGKVILFRSSGGNAYTQFTLTSSWQRISTIETAPATGASSISVAIRPYYGGSTGTVNVHLWGGQLEEGYCVTSYIPTAASQVTRPADTASLTGSNFTSWFNYDEGTLLCTSKAPSVTSSWFPEVFTISDGTSAQCYNIDYRGTGAIRLVSTDGAYVNVFTTTNGGSWNTAALAYEYNNFGASVNGLTPTSSIGQYSPTPQVTRADIGNFYGNNWYLNGHIKKVVYYPKRLTNSELQQITL